MPNGNNVTPQRTSETPLDSSSATKNISQMSGIVNNGTPTEQNGNFTPTYESLEEQSKNNEIVSAEDVKKVTGFGERGTELVTNITNTEGTTFSQALKAVKNAYNAGFENVDASQVNFETETQIDAFTAGKMDRLSQDTVQKTKSKTATAYDNEVIDKSTRPLKNHLESDIIKENTNNASVEDVIHDGTTKVFTQADVSTIADAVKETLKSEIISNTKLMTMMQERFGDDGFRVLASDIISTYKRDGNIGKYEALFTDSAKTVYDILDSIENNNDNSIYETSYSVDENEMVADDSSLKITTNEYTDVLNEMLPHTPISKVKLKVFPPDVPDMSDANHLSTRWAYKDEIKTGSQTLISYHNRWYVIEKFDSLDMKYQIIGVISKKNFQNILNEVKKRGNTIKGQSVQRSTDRLDDLYQKRDLVGGERYSAGDITTGFSRENNGIQQMGQEQNGGWKVENDPGRSDARNSTNRQNQDLTSEQSYSIDESTISSQEDLNEFERFVDNEALHNVSVRKVKMKQFPSRKESGGSDTNQYCCMWAYREDVSAGDQTIAFHNGRCYVVEKYDNIPFKYQIVGGIRYADYKAAREEILADVRNNDESTVKEIVDIYYKRNIQGSWSEGRGQGFDADSIGYRGEDRQVLQMDTDQNRGGEIRRDSSGSDARNSTNRQNQDLKSEQSYSYDDQEITVDYSVDESDDFSQKALPKGSMINKYHNELSGYEWFEYYQRVNQFDWDDTLAHNEFDFVMVLGNKIIRSHYKKGKPKVKSVDYINDSNKPIIFEEGVIYDEYTKTILGEIAETSESFHQGTDIDNALSYQGQGNLYGGNDSINGGIDSSHTDNEEVRNADGTFESIDKDEHIDKIDYSYESEEANEQGRNILSDASGKRQNSKSARQSAKKVDGRTSRYRESYANKRGRRRDCQTLKDAGHTRKEIVYGHECEVIPSEHYNDRMRRLANRNAKEGIDETIIITGQAILPSKDGPNGISKKANGMFIRTKDGRKIIVVQYDNEFHMPEKINDHELIHNNYNSSRVQKVKNLILNSLSLVERRTILERLSKDYKGIIKGNEEKIFEEFIANTLSGMNEYTAQFNDLVRAYWAGDDAAIDSFKASEYTESVDAGGENKYYSFPGGVFSPFDESQSDTNERATRWAHKKKIKTGAQRIFFYKGDAYLVEKFDSMDLGYLIIRKLSDSEVGKIDRYYDFEDDDTRYGTDKGIQSGREGTVSDSKKNQEGSEHTQRSGNDDLGFDRYNGETSDAQGIGRSQDEEWSFEYDRGGNNKRGVSNSQRQIDVLVEGAEIIYSTDTKTEDDKLLNDTFDFTSDESGKEPYGDLWAEWLDKIEQYGAIPRGENPHRDIQVPKKTANDKNVSQTVRTILESKATPDEVVPTIQKMVADGIFSYGVYTDKQAINDAETYIKKYGWEESLEDWFDSVEKGEVSKQITAMGWALYNNAANTATTTTSQTEKTTAIKTFSITLQ